MVKVPFFVKTMTTMVNKGLFSSISVHWATPREVYDKLNEEFHFNDDPCPLHSVANRLNTDWGTCVFMNPPYGREITGWLRKAYEESLKGKTIVCLLPSRTDTKWWHDYVMRAKEI